jgi:hypothetical protein
MKLKENQKEGEAQIRLVSRHGEKGETWSGDSYLRLQKQGTSVKDQVSY